MISILCPIPVATGNYIFYFLFYIRTLILVMWSRYVQCSKQLIMLARCGPDLPAQVQEVLASRLYLATHQDVLNTPRPCMRAVTTLSCFSFCSLKASKPYAIYACKVMTFR